MMKFFILALVAVSVGLSECLDFVHTPEKGYTPKEVLQVFFNIKDKDLNEKCDKVDTDKKARWEKIGQAVSDLQDAVVDARKQDPKKWEKLKDADKYKAQINVIKTALPCASEAKVNEILAFYKQLPKIPQNSYTPKEVLHVFFNINNKDLNEKCDKVDTNEKARWEKIGQAVSDLQDSVLAQLKEDPEKLKKLNDADKYKAQINVIKTALPCANEAQVAKILAFYKQYKQQQKLSQISYTPKEVLAVFFNIKDKDLNEKCDKVDTNEKARWGKIGQAVSDLQDAVLAQLKEDPEKLKKLNDADKYKAQINVIKTALPCANEAQVAKILAFYKQYKQQKKLN